MALLKKLVLIIFSAQFSDIFLELRIRVQTSDVNSSEI